MADVVLRDPGPGDLGWIVHRHGVLYAQEYGYPAYFEGLVAQVAANFLKNHDPTRERCWIADREGEILGSIMLVHDPEIEGQAKLRILLVEPGARGLGVGRMLVEACVAFAREAGYRSITLWTEAELTAARNLYERAGFKKVKEQTHTGFGFESVAETWELEL